MAAHRSLPINWVHDRRSHRHGRGAGCTRPPRPDFSGRDRRRACAGAANRRGRRSRTPRLVLGLPTGRTPLALYRELGALHAAGSRFFAGDDIQSRRVPRACLRRIPAATAASWRRTCSSHVNIPAAQHNFLNGSAPDPDAECARYEQAIADAGGIDLQILGIGTNGHIGFNEPARELQARTHRVTLKPETRRGNAALFGGDPAQVPAEALSMGMATILRARASSCWRPGTAKAGVCRAGGQWTRDDGTAGVVPAAAPRCGHHAGRGCRLGAEAARLAMAFARSAVPSAAARRLRRSPRATESFAFFSRRCACAMRQVRALHHDRGLDVPVRALQQRVGVVVVEPGDDA